MVRINIENTKKYVIIDSSNVAYSYCTYNYMPLPFSFTTKVMTDFKKSCNKLIQINSQFQNWHHFFIIHGGALVLLKIIFEFFIISCMQSKTLTTFHFLNSFFLINKQGLLYVIKNSEAYLCRSDQHFV